LIEFVDDFVVAHSEEESARYKAQRS